MHCDLLTYFLTNSLEFASGGVVPRAGSHLCDIIQCVIEQCTGLHGSKVQTVCMGAFDSPLEVTEGLPCNDRSVVTAIAKLCVSK